MTTAHSSDGLGTGGWAAAVRQRLGLGRLLPLGGARDGAWLSERAATDELRLAAAGVAGAVLGRLRLSLTDPDGAGLPAVPPPPSALPPGPLRIDGEFAAGPAEPLPAVAERLRGVLFACATERLGLRVEEVDLRVTALLDPSGEALERPRDGAAPAGPDEGRPADVRAAAPEGEPELLAAAVPGVAYPTRTLGGAVVTTPGHVRLELATAAGHRPLEVARAVRARLTAELPGAPSVAVLVTAVGRKG
ncbi:hypothetical protein [Streptomyces scopuliridis]|uniref:Nucleopolyhedrovirus P10 family protein n=1 Tax=Streptomyces scopuliridis RB72 TaxID=1440053 RepID=A0A2T7T8L3_9ACTN|nr:hypothetical protein [Streptomyces scopuliridis]PVE11396.1 hypothetical protein Y717_04055 [Streptomyces scopuliridis RB72]